jgi:hypothetical protein
VTDVIECMPVRRASTDWTDREASLHLSPRLELDQPWRAESEPDFQPGVVQIGCGEAGLYVLATLYDRDIFTDMTAHNQPAWRLGDTFEMFFKADATDPYIELHVTPNNLSLNYRFAHPAPSVETRGRPVTLPPGSFRHDVRVASDLASWQVWAEIPRGLVDATNDPQSRWRMSFSRYDATRGRPDPVLSSTAPLPRPDFHDVEHWHRVDMMWHRFGSFQSPNLGVGSPS